MQLFREPDIIIFKRKIFPESVCEVNASQGLMPTPLRRSKVKGVGRENESRIVIKFMNFSRSATYILNLVEEILLSPTGKHLSSLLLLFYLSLRNLQIRIESLIASQAYVIVVWSLNCVPLFCDPMGCSPPGSCSWDFPGRNTGMGSYSLLRGSSPPRDRTHVSCIGRQIFSAEPPRKSSTSLRKKQKRGYVGKANS